MIKSKSNKIKPTYLQVGFIIYFNKVSNTKKLKTPNTAFQSQTLQHFINL